MRHLIWCVNHQNIQKKSHTHMLCANCFYLFWADLVWFISQFVVRTSNYYYNLFIFEFLVDLSIFLCLLRFEFYYISFYFSLAFHFASFNGNKHRLPRLSYFNIQNSDETTWRHRHQYYTQASTIFRII